MSSLKRLYAENGLEFVFGLFWGRKTNTVLVEIYEKINIFTAHTRTHARTPHICQKIHFIWFLSGENSILYRNAYKILIKTRDVVWVLALSLFADILSYWRRFSRWQTHMCAKSRGREKESTKTKKNQYAFISRVSWPSINNIYIFRMMIDLRLHHVWQSEMKSSVRYAAPRAQPATLI